MVRPGAYRAGGREGGVRLLTRRASREATAAFVAAVVYVLVHPAGMPIDPDGWAAWQGAVSIATG